MFRKLITTSPPVPFDFDTLAILCNISAGGIIRPLQSRQESLLLRRRPLLQLSLQQQLLRQLLQLPRLLPSSWQGPLLFPCLLLLRQPRQPFTASAAAFESPSIFSVYLGIPDSFPCLELLVGLFLGECALGLHQPGDAFSEARLRRRESCGQRV